MATALEGAVTTIGQMGRDQLRAVIEGPLPKGVTYEAGLVERILGDVGEEPGSLPLLEFALTLLWERQDRGKLTHAAYGQLGGVGGALASYAERVYVDQLLPDDQEETRRLLIQLVRPSEVGEPVRRIARRPELGEPRWQLGQRLAATRLLVADRDPTGLESVELVHEALIGGWSRLSEWFDADRAFRTWQERLRGSVAQWEMVRRNEGALLRGAPLAEAERWLAERPDDLGAPERQFIQASSALRDRSVRRLRVVAAVLALLLLVASSLGGVALWQFNRADNQSRLAQSRALVTQANSLIDSQPDVAMLLAAAAYKIADTTEAIDTLTTMASQRRHVDRLLVTGMGGDSQIEFSPTDPTMVALTNINGIELWDIKKNILRSRHDADRVRTSTFSPDGRILAYVQGTEQGDKVVLWSHVEDRVQEVSLVRARAGSLIFSSDGKLLGACVGQRIQLWSLDPGSPHYSIPLVHETECAFGFRGGSHELAYSDGDEIVTWDIAAGRVVKSKSSRLGPLTNSRPGRLSFVGDQFFFGRSPTFVVAPDGQSAMYIGDGGDTWWDFDRREAQIIGMSDSARTKVEVSFTPDSRLAAVNLRDGVMLFDVARRTPIAVYSLIDSLVRLIGTKTSALSPDGRMIAVADSSGVITLSDTGLHHGIPVRAGPVAIQPYDEHLATVSSAGKVAIYSIGHSEPIIVRNSANDQPLGKRVENLSPNGLRYAFTDDQAQKIHLLDVSSPPASEVPIEGNRSDVLQLSFDPSGDFLACADKSEIIVWSAKNRAELSRIPLPKGYAARELTVSPGGRYVAASSSSGEARLWDTGSNDRTGIVLPFKDEKSMSFSPDGRWLSIGSQNEIRLWDLSAGKIDPRRIPAGGFSMKFSPDSSLLAAATGRGISVWNVRDVLLRGTVSDQGRPIGDFAFTSDNSRLAVSDKYIGVFVEPFDASWAMRHVCSIVGRNLTPEEWNKYLPGSGYVSTCPS